MKLDFTGILEAVMTHGPLTVLVQPTPVAPFSPVLTSANAKDILKLINILILKDDTFDIWDAEGRSVLGRKLRQVNEAGQAPSAIPHRGGNRSGP